MTPPVSTKAAWLVDLGGGPCPILAFYDRRGAVIEPDSPADAHGFKALNAGRQVWSTVRGAMPGMRGHSIWRAE